MSSRTGLVVALFTGALLQSGCVGRSVRLEPAAPAPRAQPSSIPPEVQRPLDTPPTLPSSDDITREMGVILGDAAAAGELADPLDMDISSDLEILAFASHERVAHFVSVFSGDARERTQGWYTAGTRYEPMIRARLRAAGLPEDLYFLAFVESGYDPDAYSRAAAVGMWQFMTATGKAEGLKIDWWVDERRDPELATAAAVRHLTGLRRQFGSLFLAAAAYNGGSGRLSRGLTRHANELEGSEGEGVFFALAETDYLRQETRDYVPKLIAAALVGKAAHRYGLRIDTLAPLAYDSVLVGPATPLSAVAKATGTDASVIRDLNAHVLRGFTHPRDSMLLRVPPGSSADFNRRLAALPEDDLKPYTRTTSRAGETFAAVAKRVGVSAKRLAWYNPRDGRSSRALAAGTTILVPTAGTLAGAKDVADPAIEIYGGAGARHVVKRGETLSGIALRYRTTVATLKRLNGLSGDGIRAGQSLRVR